MPRRRKTFTPEEPQGEYSEFACTLEELEQAPPAEPEAPAAPEAPEAPAAPAAPAAPERTKLYPHKEAGSRQSSRRLRFTR